MGWFGKVLLARFIPQVKSAHPCIANSSTNCGKKRWFFWVSGLNDERWRLVQPEFDHEGWVLDFYDRVQDGRLKKFMDDLPNQTYFRAVDKGLIERSVNRDLHLSGYPNPEKALDDLVGVFLMSGNEILCEALAGVEIMGTREIGIDTRNHTGSKVCKRIGTATN